MAVTSVWAHFGLLLFLDGVRIVGVGAELVEEDEEGDGHGEQQEGEAADGQPVLQGGEHQNTTHPTINLGVDKNCSFQIFVIFFFYFFFF